MIAIALTYASSKNPLARMAIVALLLVPASLTVRELRFSDIALAVSVEGGTLYVTLVWMLVALPVGIGVLGVLFAPDRDF